jgi:hypothetical protein
MSRQTMREAERLALRDEYMWELIQTSIRRRWGATDWDIFYPWWRQPEKIRILMYADGLVRFSGDPFGGLQYVKTLLESRIYFYADFDITTAHRNADPHDADQSPVKLTDLDILNRFDEIWFFGFNTKPALTPEEKDLLEQFMNGKRRGVLVTGDHFNLGKSIAGEITRVGKMRQYPAPTSERNKWNTTLVEGPDENDQFDAHDQNDDRAQKVRYTLFPVPTPIGSGCRFRPHPVMSGPDGPIDVFPDHQHEGEALAPKFEKNDTEWPTVNDYQEKPVVIAWGKISDPCAEKFGQEIGLVSAYDGHQVNVGRILADSSWHHWFDYNLLGRPEKVPPDPYAGFDATPGGRAVLKKLDAYFLNCATWLAPPDRQVEMRRAAWWSVLWTDQIVELSIDHPVWHLGAEALDALTLRASSCAAAGWVLDIPAFREQISNQQLSKITERFQLLNLPFEQYVAGGIIRELMRQVGPANSELRFPSEPPPDKVIDSAIDAGVKFGMDAFREQLNDEISDFAEMFQ